MNDSTIIFGDFCKILANKILDEYLDVNQLTNHTTRENAQFFLAFSTVLTREFLKRLKQHDTNANKIYDEEVERFEKIFSD